MKQVARDTKDLYASVPTGNEKQTYLRALLLLTDHNAYHLGQLVASPPRAWHLEIADSD